MVEYINTGYINSAKGCTFSGVHKYRVHKFHQIKCQHRKVTLEKKILPRLLPGIQPRVTAVARKRPHPRSAKSTGDGSHVNPQTPSTQRSRSGLCCPVMVWEPVIRETSSHAVRQRTLVGSRLSSLTHCRLMLAYRVKLVRAS